MPLTLRFPLRSPMPHGADRLRSRIWFQPPGSAVDSHRFEAESVAAAGEVIVPDGVEVGLDLGGRDASNPYPLLRGLRGAPFTEVRTSFGTIDHQLRTLAGVQPFWFPSLRNLCADMASVGSIKGWGALGSMSSLEQLDLNETDADDAAAFGIARLERLNSLDVGKTGIDDRGAAALLTLPRLRHLNIGKTEITEATVEAIASRTQLESLSLSGTPLTRQSLLTLSRMATLRDLYVAECRLDPRDFDVLPSFPALETFHMAWYSGSLVGDSTPAFVDFARCPKLRSLGGRLDTRSLTEMERRALESIQTLTELELGGPYLDDSVVASIARLQQVKGLLLRSNAITDDGLGKVGTLPALKELWLAGCRGFRGTGFIGGTAFARLDVLNLNYSAVGDDGLVAIARLPALRRLLLNRTGITARGLDWLQEARTLRSLHLLGVTLDEAAIDALCALTWLDELRVSRVSADGLERLRATLPHCRIN